MFSFSNRTLGAFVGLFLTFLALQSCGSSRVELRLQDLDPALTDFAEDSTYDYVTGKNGYVPIGIAQYDQLFADAAMTRAVVSQIKFSLERIVGDSTRLPENAQTGLFAVAMLKMAKSQLPTLPSRVEGVIQKLRGMNPTADFTGTKALQLPTAISSLKTAVSDMNTALLDVKRIADLILLSEGGKPQQNAVTTMEAQSKEKGVDASKIPIAVKNVTGTNLNEDMKRFAQSRVAMVLRNANYDVVTDSNAVYGVRCEFLLLGSGYALHVVLDSLGTVIQELDWDERGDFQMTLKPLLLAMAEALPKYTKAIQPVVEKQQEKIEEITQDTVSLVNPASIDSQAVTQTPDSVVADLNTVDLDQPVEEEEEILSETNIVETANEEKQGMSWRKKIGWMLLACSAGGAGGAYWADQKGLEYAEQYDEYRNARNYAQMKQAYDNIDEFELYRNSSIGFSIGTGVLGLILILLPE